MNNINALTLKELETVFAGWGQPVFHARQIFNWIYQKQITDFSAMSDLSCDLKRRLKENFYIRGLKIIKILKSCDGTEKLLLQLKDKNAIEAVAIPARNRLTGCISTQVGCKFACRLCASGLPGLKRNLTSGEIIEEILCLKDNAQAKKLTHLVFMGTGEPLDNYENVIKAVRMINSPYSFNIGARRITISTCGIIPGIKRLSQENLQIELSVSLHAADEKVRSQIMPVNKIYPLVKLISACQEYIQKTNRQVTLEYVLIKGINSHLQMARKLGKIVRQLKLCKVNLIPCNFIRELKVEPPKKQEILLFRDYLLKQGVNVTLRKPRGEDIEAACGQLRLKYEKI